MRCIVSRPISAPLEGDHDKDNFIRADISSYEPLNRTVRSLNTVANYTGQTELDIRV